MNIAICPMPRSLGQESLTWRRRVGEDAVLEPLRRRARHNYFANRAKNQRRAPQGDLVEGKANT